MTSKFTFALAAVAAISATAPAIAGPQSLEGLSPNEIAAVRYNVGRSLHDRQAISIDRNGSPALEEQAIASYNVGMSVRDWQDFMPAPDMDVSSRSINPGNPADIQLIGSAGLTVNEAEGLTLNEIAAIKYNRGRSLQDRQSVGDFH